MRSGRPSGPRREKVEGFQSAPLSAAGDRAGSRETPLGDRGPSASSASARAASGFAGSDQDTVSLADPAAPLAGHHVRTVGEPPDHRGGPEPGVVVLARA